MNKKITCWIVLLVIAATTYLAFFGFTAGNFHIAGADEMRYGIDIRGGVEATFQPEGGYDPSDEELNVVKRVLGSRCDDQNILDREITVDKDHGSVLVRFPWKADEKDFKPEEAIKELGEMKNLTFREPDGLTVILTGKDVKSATYNGASGLDGHTISLELNSDGAKKFEEATGRLIGQSIGIFMDEDRISAPTVQTQISGNQASITGITTAEEASKLADDINNGALPYALESSNYSTISPTMGQGALDVMVQAGLLAFIIVCLFMLIYYRLPGFVAIFALILQVAGQLLALSVPQMTLTLPGIAAVILSIGMGVDANIITAERIKEEIADGKTVRAAIDSGFHKAFSSVFDGNITVMIVSIVLMVFGSGTMLSFGYSLLTGVILNFLCGVLTTKLLMKSFSSYAPLRKSGLYGSGKKSERVVKFNKHKKKFYGISALLIVVGIVFMFINGINLDIQFKGGAILNYKYEGTVDTNKVDQIVEETLGRTCDIQTKEDLIDSSKSSKKLVISLAGKESLENSAQATLNDKLTESFPENNIQIDSSTIVEPFMGRDFAVDCAKAVILSAILIILYVWFSFRKVSGLSAGVAGLIALFHDVLIVFFAFIVFGIPINESFISAALTILGFSINDTIVIFDRIRENKYLMGNKVDIEDVVDKSISQSFTRSLNTSLCTLFSIVVIFVFAFIKDIPSITSFALPMIFGIICGCYSSVCIAGPIWTSWQKHKAAKK